MLRMVRLPSFASLVALFLFNVFAVDGVPIGNKPPVLVCHVPLELKIFADSSFQATSADLKSCTQITFSSANALFLPNTNAAIVSEARNLDLLKQQTPEALFSFSLRSNASLPKQNLKTIFNGPNPIVLLVEYLLKNKLKSFDIAWDLIQSTPNYMVLLKTLKSTLMKEGIELTTTIGVEVNRTNSTHVSNIASIVDRIFLVPSFNRHYNGGIMTSVTKEPEQAFDTLELNEGAFLKLYTSLNLNLQKVVVGLSLQTLVWKLGGGVTVGPNLNQNKAVLQLQPYYESCKTFSKSWQISQQQPSQFYHLALAPSKDQWMIHIDPLTLGRRVDLLRQYGFAGVALYDYYQDDFAGVCNGSGKVYPLIQQAGRSIRSSNPAPFPEIDVKAGLCLPFLGLTTECQGAFNFGTPKTSTFVTEPSTTLAPSTAKQFNPQITSSSAIPLPRTTRSSVSVIDTELPAFKSSATTQSTKYTPESIVTTFRSLVDSVTPEVRIAISDHLVRTRRSSVSEELGTQPSDSFLNPPEIGTPTISDAQLLVWNVDSSTVDTSIPSLPINNSNPVSDAAAGEVEQSTGTQKDENQTSTGIDQLMQSTTDSVPFILPVKTKAPQTTSTTSTTVSSSTESQTVESSVMIDSEIITSLPTIVKVETPSPTAFPSTEESSSTESTHIPVTTTVEVLADSTTTNQKDLTSENIVISSEATTVSTESTIIKDSVGKNIGISFESATEKTSLTTTTENLTSGNIVTSSETAKVPAESTTINQNDLTTQSISTSSDSSSVWAESMVTTESEDTISDNVVTSSEKLSSESTAISFHGLETSKITTLSTALSQESTSDSIVTSETLTESGNAIIGDSGSSLETEPVLLQSTPSTNTDFTNDNVVTSSESTKISLESTTTIHEDSKPTHSITTSSEIMSVSTESTATSHLIDDITVKSSERETVSIESTTNSELISDTETSKTTTSLSVESTSSTNPERETTDEKTITLVETETTSSQFSDTKIAEATTVSLLEIKQSSSQENTEPTHETTEVPQSVSSTSSSESSPSSTFDSSETESTSQTDSSTISLTSEGQPPETSAQYFIVSVSTSEFQEVSTSTPSSSVVSTISDTSRQTATASFLEQLITSEQVPLEVHETSEHSIIQNNVHPSGEISTVHSTEEILAVHHDSTHSSFSSEQPVTVDFTSSEAELSSTEVNLVSRSFLTESISPPDTQTETTNSPTSFVPTIGLSPESDESVTESPAITVPLLPFTTSETHFELIESTSSFPFSTMEADMSSSMHFTSQENSKSSTLSVLSMSSKESSEFQEFISSPTTEKPVLGSSQLPEFQPGFEMYDELDNESTSSSTLSSDVKTSDSDDSTLFEQQDSSTESTVSHFEMTTISNIISTVGLSDSSTSIPISEEESTTYKTTFSSFNLIQEEKESNEEILAGVLDATDRPHLMETTIQEVTLTSETKTSFIPTELDSTVSKLDLSSTSSMKDVPEETTAHKMDLTTSQVELSSTTRLEDVPEMTTVRDLGSTSFSSESTLIEKTITSTSALHEDFSTGPTTTLAGTTVHSSILSENATESPVISNSSSPVFTQSESTSTTSGSASFSATTGSVISSNGLLTTHLLTSLWVSASSTNTPTEISSTESTSSAAIWNSNTEPLHISSTTEKSNENFSSGITGSSFTGSSSTTTSQHITMSSSTLLPNTDPSSTETTTVTSTISLPSSTYNPSTLFHMKTTLNAFSLSSSTSKRHSTAEESISTVTPISSSTTSSTELSTTLNPTTSTTSFHTEWINLTSRKPLPIDPETTKRAEKTTIPSIPELVSTTVHPTDLFETRPTWLPSRTSASHSDSTTKTTNWTGLDRIWSTVDAKTSTVSTQTQSVPNHPHIFGTPPAWLQSTNDRLTSTVRPSTDVSRSSSVNDHSTTSLKSQRLPTTQVLKTSENVSTLEGPATKTTSWTVTTPQTQTPTSTTQTSSSIGVFETRPFWLKSTTDILTSTVRPYTDLSRSSSVNDDSTTPLKSHRLPTTQVLKTFGNISTLDGRATEMTSWTAASTTSQPQTPTSTTQTSTSIDVFETLPFWLQTKTDSTDKSTIDPHRTTSVKSYRGSTTLSDESIAPETTKIPLISKHDGPREDQLHKRNVTFINSSVGFNVKDVVNSIIIQLNINAQLTDDQKVNTSLYFEKIFGDLDRFLNLRFSEPPKTETKPSAICEAAGDSLLLKTLFCSSSLSTTEHKRFPDLMELTKRLAPAIIANLTATLNLTENSDDNNDYNNQTDSSTESSTISTVLMDHFTTLINLSTMNESTSSEVATNWSYFTNTTEVSVQSLMVNLSNQLENAKLSSMVSAINLLNITVPSGWLESILVNAGQIDFDNKTNTVKPTTEVILTTTTSPTTTLPKEIDILSKDFWKTRSNPLKTLQRESVPSVKTMPTMAGRRWRTIVPAPSFNRQATMRRVAKSQSTG